MALIEIAPTNPNPLLTSLGIGTPTVPASPGKPTGTPSVNLVANPSFEVGTSEFTNWTNTVSDGAISVESTRVHSGTRAVRLTQGASNATKIRTENITVAAGTVYNLSFWTCGEGTYDVQYYIRDVSHSAVITDYTNSGVPGTAYARVSVSFTTPAGCTSIYVSFAVRSFVGTVNYIDDVAVSVAATGAVPDASYRYKVTALNAGGESLGSTESDAVVVSGGGFGASVALTWTAAAGATSYRIYRTTTQGVYASPCYIANPVTNSYTDAIQTPAAGAPPALLPLGLATTWSTGVLSAAGIIAGYLRPVNDTTTALQVQTCAGQSLLNFDTLNGIVTLANPKTGGATSLLVNAGGGQAASPVATFGGNISLGGIESPTAPTVALGAAGLVNGTNYRYMISFVTACGETGVVYGADLSAAISPTNQKVLLSAIPVSASPEVTARRIYRTKSNVAATYYLVNTLTDNTTTTYTDNTPDASLGVSNHGFSSGIATAGAIYANKDGVAVRLFKAYGVSLCLGQNAGIALTDCDNNTIIGDLAGLVATTVQYLTVLGAQAGTTLVTGNENTFVGGKSGYLTNGASHNTFLGSNSGYSNTTGGYNTAVGKSAGEGGDVAPGTNANKSGSYNTFIGYGAGPASTTQLSYAGAIGPLATVGASYLINIGAANQAVGVNVTATAFGTNNKFLVNNPATADNLATAHITPAAATNKGLVVQGYASQSANLQEWQGSNAAVLACVSSAGIIQGAGYKSSDGTAGATGTITLTEGTVTVKNGLITATTCPFA
jgi:hypothetical protein